MDDRIQREFEILNADLIVLISLGAFTLEDQKMMNQSSHLILLVHNILIRLIFLLGSDSWV
jgi:hypothetical protein